MWFGEAVPMMEKAIAVTSQADIFAVVGTSLLVYPAASLVDFVPDEAEIYVIDPNLPAVPSRPHLHLWAEKASTGMERLWNEIVENK